MNWIVLNNEEQLTAIKALSNTKAQVIFKHSTRCAISSIVKSRLERSTQPAAIDFYYLDLINYRDISKKVAEEFSVAHESPQIILIKNETCTYDESHNGIQMDDIEEQAVK